MVTFFNKKLMSAAEDFGEEPSVMGAGGRLPPRPRIIVPSFCKIHLHDFIVKRLEMDFPNVPDTEWQRWMITGQLLLFELVLRAERTQKLLRKGRDLQEILSTQGCLACGHFRAYTFMVRFLKAKGLTHGSLVAAGEVVDSEFAEWK